MEEADVGVAPLQRVQQTEHWDCGLACLAAILQRFSAGTPTPSLDDLKGLIDTTHVWTIDLCSVFRRAQDARDARNAQGAESGGEGAWPPHTLHTTSPGVRPEYAKMGFYAEEFEADQRRIQALFQEAAVPGSATRIAEGIISLDKLREHLSAGALALCLVDNRKMACQKCQKMAVRGTSAGYLGHYVVLQGLTDTDAVYMDPGPNRCSLHCRTPVGVFDAARKSEGTDADCIVFSPA